MKCLVTGGAGFIGSHLQDKLIELGHQVAILDNFSSGKHDQVNPQTEVFTADIRRREEVSRVFAKFAPEAVFHLAAQIEVPYSLAHPDEDLEINLKGTLNVLEACRGSKIQKLVYTNTGGAYYGDVPEDRLPITEDEPVRYPTSAYGVSKAAAEQYVRLYGHVYHLPWVSLRYSNVYGPRQAGNRESGIVAIFTAKMLAGQVPTINGDGLHTRDYIYVGDVVAANITALTYPQNDYFNICTAIRISNQQVFATIENQLKTGLTPIHGPARSGDARHVSLSYAKAAKLLNWSPKVNFAEGIRLTLESYGRHALA